MAKSEKDILLNIVERLARIEERLTLEFEHTEDEIKGIKKHVGVINDEMGKICERLNTVEDLYFKAKASYERASWYWKVVAFVLSPVVTLLLMSLVKLLLGLPIP